jgi:hypothetical protein
MIVKGFVPTFLEGVGNIWGRNLSHRQSEGPVSCKCYATRRAMLAMMCGSVFELCTCVTHDVAPRVLICLYQGGEEYLSNAPSHLDGYVAYIQHFMTRGLKGISVCTGVEQPAPVYMHAQRWGGGFKANVLSDACLIDTCEDLFPLSEHKSSICGILRD